MSAIGGPNIVEDGLVLALDAANVKSYPGSGTNWTDLSGNGNNGTLTNGPTFDSANLGSISFDGVDDYIDMGDKFNTLTGTISFWIKLTNSISVPSSQNQRPWGKNGNFESRWGGGNTTSNASLINDIGASNSTQTVQNEWLNTVWYNIATTYDESTNTSKIYVQGVLNATGTAGNVTGLTGNFNIGRSSTGGYIDGKISNFLIYDRVLLSTEVLQNYNATKGRFGL